MSGPARRILLVDDDPLVVKVYAERMRFEGWSVAVARDGWEASQEARRTRFDMILLDIRMPYHDGVEVLKEIRQGETNGKTPVYILTSLTRGEDVDDALRLGADGVFYKSQTRPDELVREVSSILAEVASAAGPPRSRERAGVVAGPGSEETAGLLRSLEETPPSRARSRPAPGPRPAPPPPPPPEAAPRPAAPVSLQRDFRLYVNPFLGDGQALSRALGLAAPYQCPACGGQVCLRLSPDVRGKGHEMTGFFHCSRCEQEI